MNLCVVLKPLTDYRNKPENVSLLFFISALLLLCVHVVSAQSPVFTNPTAAYNVSAAEYSGTAFNVSSELGSPYGITFSADGTRMYVSGIFSSEIAEYSLAVSFDVATATYVTSLTGMSDRTTGINFNNDGTKLYHVGANSSANVVEYDVSTPYDLTSAVHSQTYVASEESSYKDVTFNGDGTRMYLLGYNGNTIYEYSLSQAFDTSTSVYTNHSYAITEHSYPMEIDFNGEGTQLFAVTIGGQVLAYDLSTPFDLSTISYNSIVFDNSSEEPNAYGMAFASNGEKFYVIGFSKNVYEYHMGVSLEYEENATIEIVDIDAHDGNGGANDEGITYSLASEGDYTLFTIDTSTGELNFLDSPDFENPIDANTDNEYEISVIATDSDGSTERQIVIDVEDLDEPPVITNFSPKIAGNGETITITGSNFIGTTSVEFGGIAASGFTVDSDGQITAVAGTGSSGDISVSSPGGDDTIAGFIYKLAQYDFENSADDATGNNYDGTEINVVTYDTGSQGQAICFDNGPGYIKLPDNLIRSLPEFTISLRFKTTASGAILGYQNVEAVIYQTPSNYIPVLMIMDDGKLKGLLWTGPTGGTIEAVSANPVNDGNWHQVDYVADSNSVSIYLDGNLEASQSGAAVDHTDMIYNQLGMAFTANYNQSATTWEYFDGCLDDMVIIDRALTAQELEDVTALPEPTITSFTPTDAGQEDTIVITGTNFDGATQVTFGGIDAASYTVDSSTQITALLGHTGDSGDVEVINAGGTATLGGFTFTSKTDLTLSTNTLSEIIYCANEASAPESFQVSGTGLYEDLVITAPAGFEISLVSDSGYTNSVTLTPSSNTVPSTTLYVRTASGQDGELSGNINVTSGTSSEDIAISSATNNALYFDGEDDFVSLNANTIEDGATDFTIETWILPDNSNWDGEYHAIIGKEAVATNMRNPSFYIHSGNVHVDMYEDETLNRYDFLTEDPIVLQNVWTHMALVKEGLEYRFFVNGELILSREAPQHINIAGSYQIGYIDNYFAGKIDDLRFWNTPRTQSQIEDNMNVTLNGDEEGLVGYYTFNQGVAEGNNTSETSLTDKSTAGIDGTLNNMALTSTSSNWVDGYFAQLRGEHIVYVDEQLQLEHSQSGGTWSSDDLDIATVDQSGLVTGVAFGTVNITYELCGQSTFKVVEVEYPFPSITSFSPESAGEIESVVITGTFFDGATQVSFGGTNANSYTVDSATQITAMVSSTGTSGDVAVTTAGGTATKSGFTFLEQPVLSYISGISLATLENSLDVSANQTGLLGFAFDPSGTKMYTLGADNTREIDQYELTEAFDISTAIYSQNYVVSSVNPSELRFNSDGTKMYVGSYVNNDVKEYNLASSYDVSSASYVGAFSFTAQESNPFGLDFNLDGSKMYMVGDISDTVFEYNLSTPFSIATASVTANTYVVAEDGSPRGLSFGKEGRKMYIIGDQYNKVYEYNLDPAFDITSATLADSYTIAEDISPYDVEFNTTNDRMFVLGQYTNTIYEYSFGASYEENLANDGSLDNSKALKLLLANDTFVDLGSSQLTAAQVTIPNLPAGLTPVFTIDSTTEVTLTFTGNATDHIDEDDVENLNFVFTDAAFGRGNASIVENSGASGGYASEVSINFNDNPPVIDSFTPDSAESGETVVITGMYFDGATQVAFGNTGATSFTVDSSTQISAVVDEGTTGSIAVTTTVGTGTATGFTYLHPDTDKDGVRDDTDNCISIDNASQTDTDSDGAGDACDDDDDDDGTPDTDDDFPLDENEDTDTDGDGTGDNTDTDDDDDGTPDSDDDFPLDENEDTDTDGDGTGDNADTDDDDDGTPDSDDDFPLDGNEDTDTDGDGAGDNADMDDDGDGTPDSDDDFPLDSNEDTDTDGDGTGDDSDDDIDGDGIPNGEDVFPNGEVTDSDNDGVPDTEDAFPNDPNESVDKDGDGIGANADLDDNNAIIGEERAIISAEAFTPNGDGINDTYVIQGIQNHPNAMVTVYNRYGHEVFKAINYQNDWTGRNGSGSGMLPAGSYYYVIDLRNGSTPMDGWIFINY